MRDAVVSGGAPEGAGSAALGVRVESITASFQRRFGAPPAGIWAAPGRVNLIGEHTDYNGGLVLPFAIEACALVAARARGDDLLRLHSAQQGACEVSLSAVAPGKVSGWARYVAGAAAAFASYSGEALGLDLSLDSDVPIGAGLSSSAAIQCATLAAMVDLRRCSASPLELARMVQQVESRYAGVPCGLMDPLASLLAAPGHAVRIDCARFEMSRVPLQLAARSARLLIIDTRAPRLLSEGPYAERRADCEAVAERCGVGLLSELSRAQLGAAQGALPERLLRRARHVLGENERVTRTVAALQRSDLAEVGRLLSASHESLRRDFEVTVPPLDVAAEAAEGAGAWGARMVGGGFGGSVLALCPAAGEGVAEAVRVAFAKRGFGEPRITSVEPSAGARRLV